MAEPQPRNLKKNELVRAFLSNGTRNVRGLAARRPELDPWYLKEAITLYQRLRRAGKGDEVTPLLAAILTGDLILCKYLLQEEVDVNGGHVAKLRPLSSALHNRHYDIAELLIEAGADVKLTNKNKVPPINYAIHEDSPPHIVEALLAAGVEKEGVLFPGTGERPLMKAVRVKNKPLVKFLLDQSVETNFVCAKNITPLLVAASANSVEIAELLVNAGSKVDGLGKGDPPPLFAAVGHFDAKIFKMLIDSGANPNTIMEPLQYKNYSIFNDSPYRLIHFAVSMFNVEVLKIILENGTDTINSLDEKKNLTPLQIILTRPESKLNDHQGANYAETIQLLLKNGADLNVKLGKLELTCFVIEKEKWIALKELIKFGININSPIYHGYSVFHSLLMKNQYELAKMCLEYGADAFAKTSPECGSLSPLQLAETNGSPQMIELLLKHSLSGLRLPVDPADEHYLSFVITEALVLLERDICLANALIENNTKEVQRSLEKGAKIVNGELFMTVRSLCFPILYRNHELVDILLQHGVHVHKSYVHLAVKFGNIEVLKALLAHGAVYNQKNCVEFWPLVFAIIFAPERVENQISIGLGDLCENPEEALTTNGKTIIQGLLENHKCVSQEEAERVVKNQQNQECTCSFKLSIFKDNTRTTWIMFPEEEQLKNGFNESEMLLKDISKMFSMVRKGDSRVLKMLKTRMKKNGLSCYINCKNSKGNTLMAEALRLGFTEIADEIMNMRLKRD